MTYIPEQLLPLTAFGDMRTAEIVPIFQGSFEYTVDNTDLNTNTVANGGTVTQADAMACVGTSTTTSSTAEFRAKRHAKYRPGMGALCRFTALFTTGVAGTEQYIGLLDDNGSGAAFKNGLAVGYDGVTFGFHRFVNDTKVTIAQADWDDPLDGTGKTGMTLDHTKINVFAIRFQYLGAGKIDLLVENEATGNLEVVHTIDYANQNTVPHSYNPNYHFIIWTNNGATTSDMVMKGASYAYFTEGKTDYYAIHQPQNSSSEQIKSSVTTEVAIFTIKNKGTYASKPNFIDILLENLAVSIEASGANNLGNARLVLNATLGGSPSFSDINTSNSVVSIDTAGTTVTGGKELITVPLAGKNDSVILNSLDFDVILQASETITLAGSSASSATIKGSLLWKELF